MSKRKRDTLNNDESESANNVSKEKAEVSISTRKKSNGKGHSKDHFCCALSKSLNYCKIENFDLDGFEADWQKHRKDDEYKVVSICITYIRQSCHVTPSRIPKKEAIILHTEFCEKAAEFVRLFQVLFILQSPLPCHFSTPPTFNSSLGLPIPCFQDERFTFIRQSNTNICILHQLFMHNTDLLPLWKVLDFIGRETPCSRVNQCALTCQNACKRFACYTSFARLLKISGKRNRILFPSCIYACISHLYGISVTGFENILDE